MSRYLAEILADPVVRTLNPRGKRFLTAHKLSNRINPFDVEISALVVNGFPSLKSVPAFEMLLGDFQAGLFRGVDTLVVPSSGNTAFALARLAPAFGFKNVVIVLSTDVPPLKRGVLAALPATTVIETAHSTMDVSRELTARRGAATYLLDQYGHEGNRRSHEMHTGPEILRVMGGSVDILMIALGSAGTAMGVSRCLKRHDRETIVLGSQPLAGEHAPGTRDAKKIAIVPFDWRSMLDGVVLGTGEGAAAGMRALWSEVEPIQGPSAGLSFDCLLRYLAALPARDIGRLKGKRAAFLCHDGGLLYPDFAARARQAAIAA